MGPGVDERQFDVQARSLILCVPISSLFWVMVYYFLGQGSSVFSVSAFGIFACERKPGLTYE